MNQDEYEQLLDSCISSISGISNISNVDKNNKIIYPLASITYSPTKTYINNFTKICNFLNREPTLFLNFIKTELDSDVSLNGSVLSIKMKCEQKKINSLYRKFIEQFVICNSCKQNNTIIEINNKLNILKCLSCLSEKTIQIY